MRHPLEFIPLVFRRPLLHGFLLLTFFIFGMFRLLDAPLQTDAAPNGIVSFELAWTAETAKSILTSWDAEARLFAAFGLGLDYLFIPAYALALSIGLLLSMKNKVGWYSRLAAWMGWGAFAAALFDAVENYALWKELTGSVFSPYPEIAAACASVKFALLLAGLLVVVAGRFVKA